MKKYLKVELGSRGEIDDVYVVVGSLESFEEDLEGYRNELSEEDLEYEDEFISIFEKEDEEDVIIENSGEERGCYYIGFDKYEEDCIKLKELFDNGSVEEFSDLMDKFW